MVNIKQEINISFKTDSEATLKKLQELNSELKEITHQTTEFAKQSQSSGESLRNIETQAGKLLDAVNAVHTELSKPPETGSLEGLAQAVGAVTAAYGAYKSAVHLLGFENEKLGETMKNLEAAGTAVASLMQLTETLQKKSAASILARNILQKIGITQDLQEAVSKSLTTTATNLQTAAEQKGTVGKLAYGAAAKTVTAIQWLWNKAVMANPVVLLVAALAAAAVGIAAITSSLKKSSKEQEAANKAQSDYEAQAQKTADTIDDINRRQSAALDERKNQMREEILKMQENGATAEQIAEAKATAEEDLRNIEIAYSKERQAAKEDELKASDENLKKQQEVLNKAKEGSKKYEEQKKKVEELTRAHQVLFDTIREEQQIQKDLNLQNAEATEKRKQDDKKAAEDRRKQYQDDALKTLDMQKKFQDEQHKFVESSMSDDFHVRQKWNAQKFADNLKHEQEKLEMQRKFGRITAAEYATQMKILELQQQTFNNNQISELNKYHEEQRRQLAALIGKSVEEQIRDLEKKYADAAKAFTIPEPAKRDGQSDEDYKRELESFKALQLDKAKLESQLQAEIKNIRDSARAADIAAIEKEMNEKYGTDLRKFTDNEREKTQVAIQQLQEQIKLKKDAGLETYEDEAKLRAEQSKLNQIHLNDELLKTNENARAKFEAKKAFLEAELEIYQDNADKKLEIEQLLAEAEQELLEAKIESFTEWSDRTMEVLNGVNDLMKAQDEAKIQKYEADNERKKQALKSQLDAGLISEQEYNNKVAAADKELDNKKKALAIEQAKRDKAIGITQAIINTALAITSALSTKPFLPMGPIMAAVAAGMGAIQIATIASQPLPKARRGMLLRGASHAYGGIPIEAEGGEAIINKRSTAQFLPLLSAINEAGGGVSFTGAPAPNYRFQDGGYVSRAVQRELSEQAIAGALAKEIQHIKVYTTIEDFRRADANYTNITDFSNT